jgi:hypothetical protein
MPLVSIVGPTGTTATDALILLNRRSWITVDDTTSATTSGSVYCTGTNLESLETMFYPSLPRYAEWIRPEWFNTAPPEAPAIRRYRDPEIEHLREDNACAAIEKATALLREHISAAQWRQLEEFGHFDAIGARTGRRYQIRHGYAGNIVGLDVAGRPDVQYCIHPDMRMPTEDVMLAQVLLIECNEELFLRTANATRVRAT